MARPATEEPPQTPQRAPKGRLSGGVESANRSLRHSAAGARRVSLATVASSTMNRASAPQQPPETPIRASAGNTGSGTIAGKAPSQYDIEQWMKLLRTSRFNAENSWNFPLIDYFHDIVKDGDSINFQKASYTLDGCVKVYTTRVDSLVAKTSRLLSGLVGSELPEDELADGDDVDAEEESGEGNQRKSKKTRARKTATCVANPRTLDLDLDKFRQMAGSIRSRQDFDEGGTSGTRLWKETTDEMGWVGGRSGSAGSEVPASDGASVDVAFYRNTFLSDATSKSVHPSATAIDVAVADPQASTAALVEEVQGWSLNDPLDAGADADGNDENPPDLLADGDLDYDHLSDAFSTVGQDIGDAEDAHTGDGLNWEMMAYFDERATTGWAGPTHWRVQHYHKLKGSLPGSSAASATQASSKGDGPKRRGKEALVVDFFADPVNEEEIFTEGTHIDLPKSQRSTSRHLLPDDFHVTSKQMLRVSLRPDDGPAPAFLKAIPKHQHATQDLEDQNAEMNEQFWGQISSAEPLMYDADFYQADEGPDSEELRPQTAGTFDGINALSQTRRSDQIAFARVARNVDVQQLKTNMWSSLQETTEVHPTDPLTLSTVMHDTAAKYPPEKQSELSTPFYFICILHLANEQGLTLSSTGDLSDLNIQTRADAVTN